MGEMSRDGQSGREQASRSQALSALFDAKKCKSAQRMDDCTGSNKTRNHSAAQAPQRAFDIFRGILENPLRGVSNRREKRRKSPSQAPRILFDEAPRAFLRLLTLLEAKRALHGRLYGKQ